MGAKLGTAIPRSFASCFIVHLSRNAHALHHKCGGKDTASKAISSPVTFLHSDRPNPSVTEYVPLQQKQRVMQRAHCVAQHPPRIRSSSTNATTWSKKFTNGSRVGCSTTHMSKLVLLVHFQGQKLHQPRPAPLVMIQMTIAVFQRTLHSSPQTQFFGIFSPLQIPDVLLRFDLGNA